MRNNNNNNEDVDDVSSENGDIDDESDIDESDIDESEPMPEIDTNPTITDAYTEIQTKSHGITFILRNVYNKKN